MRIGVFSGDVSGVRSLDDLVDGVVAAEARGFHSVWLPAVSGHDPLIALALAAARTTSIEFGTAVVPTYFQHPFALAQSAMSLHIASGGRFVLGIGPSHRRVVEGRLGLTYDKPVANTRDTVEIITRLAHGGRVEYEGDEWSVAGDLQHPGLMPFPVVIAALGPQMLRLAGRVAAGTFTWMSGPVTLGGHTTPTLRAAAESHDRDPDDLRVIAGVPVVVCDAADAAAQRQRGGERFAKYGMLPSYRAMLDREGWDGPTQAIIAGDEEAVGAELRRYADAGVTDFAAVEFADEVEHAVRTSDFLSRFRA